MWQALVGGAYGAVLTGRQVAAVHAMLSAYVDRFRQGRLHIACHVIQRICQLSLLS
jgi:hypothetical protein